jgi:hypothetical protein
MQTMTTALAIRNDRLDGSDVTRAYHLRSMMGIYYTAKARGYLSSKLAVVVLGRLAHSLEF